MGGAFLDAEKVSQLGIVVSHVQYKEWQVCFVGFAN